MAQLMQPRQKPEKNQLGKPDQRPGFAFSSPAPGAGQGARPELLQSGVQHQRVTPRGLVSHVLSQGASQTSLRQIRSPALRVVSEQNPKNYFQTALLKCSVPLNLTLVLNAN